MKIRKTYLVTCRGCKQDFHVYNYEGLDPGSRMGSHHCKEISELLFQRPRIRKLYTNEREVKEGKRASHG